VSGTPIDWGATITENDGRRSKLLHGAPSVALLAVRQPLMELVPTSDRIAGCAGLINWRGSVCSSTPQPVQQAPQLHLDFDKLRRHPSFHAPRLMSVALVNVVHDIGSVASMVDRAGI
jgi:hypothetical protein